MVRTSEHGTKRPHRKIIGAAHKVLFALKPGLDESLYERALLIELTKQGLPCECQRQYKVQYDGQHIGTLIPDLIVGGTVIVDPKVVSAVTTLTSRR